MSKTKQSIKTNNIIEGHYIRGKRRGNYIGEAKKTGKLAISYIWNRAGMVVTQMSALSINCKFVFYELFCTYIIQHA